MKIVITGGAGVAGKACTAELLGRGHEVRCIDLLEAENPQAENLVVDVMDLGAVEEAVDGFDAILHLAAIPAPRPRPQWPEVWRVNAISTYNVFEAAAQRKVPKVVIASSICASGFCGGWKGEDILYLPVDEDHPARPQEPYSVSKLANEFTARSFSMSLEIDAICMRLGNIRYPKGDGLGYLACDRTFATIRPEEVAQGFRCALETEGIRFGVYHLTGLYRYNEAGEIESPAEVVESIRTRLGGRPEIRNPDWVFSGKSTFDLTRTMEDLGYDPPQ